MNIFGNRSIVLTLFALITEAGKTAIKLLLMWSAVSRSKQVTVNTF